MSEHTPGPWQWYWRETDGEADCSVVSEPFPGHAYCIARCPKYQKQEQWEANARLIAAAPELLAALGSISDHTDDRWARGVAEEAIAKAEARK